MNVQPITPSAIGPVAAALARAFADDPFFRWLYGEGAHRRIVRSFRSELRVLYVSQGHGYTVDGHHGAALWAPPGRGLRPTLWQSLRLVPGHLRFIPPDAMFKALRAFNAMDAHHPREPHAHLVILGVDPAHQRSGIGTALLDDGLQRAEAAGLPVYLDTTNPDNIPFYERFGFEITCDFDLPHGGPRTWGMLRRV